MLEGEGSSAVALDGSDEEGDDRAFHEHSVACWLGIYSDMNGGFSEDREY